MPLGFPLSIYYTMNRISSLIEFLNSFLEKGSKNECVRVRFFFRIVERHDDGETASEGGKPSYYNRAFFLTPEGNAYYYDKRHLFRMGHETEHFTPGNRRPIIRYRGWNILLLVCYDLRFPVWSRNTSNEYDLLIYVANWPIPRRKVWDILLQARALENISYVCGVNRIGKDGRDIPHSGGSVVYSPKGEVLATVPDNEEAIATASLNLSSLQEFRLKFPAWKDADEFVISSNNSSQ